jgi:hypothetical protein
MMKRKTDSQLHTQRAKPPTETKGMQFGQQTDRDRKDKTQNPGGLELAISP